MNRNPSSKRRFDFIRERTAIVSICVMVTTACLACSDKKPNANQSGKYASIQVDDLSSWTKYAIARTGAGGPEEPDGYEDVSVMWCCGTSAWFQEGQDRDSLGEEAARQAAELFGYQVGEIYTAPYFLMGLTAYNANHPEWVTGDAYAVIERDDSAVVWCCGTNEAATRKVEDSLEARAGR